MKKIAFALLFIMQAFLLLGQTSKSVLNDSAIHSKLQTIKDNMDQLFETFKSDKRPDPAVNFDDSYFTNLEFYNVAGTISFTDFDNSMSFHISTSDYKKATKADFEKAYAELADDLKTTFDLLEIREKQAAQMKELTLFEMGKDTNAPVADPNSPKYYIDVKFTEENEGKTPTYTLFLYFTSKK